MTGRMQTVTEVTPAVYQGVDGRTVTARSFTGACLFSSDRKTSS